MLPVTQWPTNYKFIEYKILFNINFIDSFYTFIIQNDVA